MRRTDPRLLEQYMRELGWRDYWHKWLDNNVKARMVAERGVLMNVHRLGYLAGMESLDE